jgi:hypothetical protein
MDGGWYVVGGGGGRHARVRGQLGEKKGHSKCNKNG